LDIQNVGDIDFLKSDFLPLKIQINSKKPGFGKEKSVEDMVTLGPKAQATLVNMNLKTIQMRDYVNIVTWAT